VDVVSQHAGRVSGAQHVTLEHTRGTARADLLVLADGLASGTRHLVTGPRPHARYTGYTGYTAWRGMTRPAADAPAPGQRPRAGGAVSASASSRSPTGDLRVRHRPRARRTAGRRR